MIPDRHNKDANQPDDSTNYITAFSDASYYQGVFGFAVWVKSREGTYRSTKYGRCENSGEAERLGLIHAIEYIKTLDLNDRVIVIQCDNINELRKIEIKPLLDLGAEFVKKKHVKAHTNNKTSRTAVNSWCDYHASKARLSYCEQMK